MSHHEAFRDVSVTTSIAPSVDFRATQGTTANHASYRCGLVRFGRSDSVLVPPVATVPLSPAIWIVCGLGIDSPVVGIWESSNRVGETVVRYLYHVPGWSDSPEGKDFWQRVAVIETSPLWEQVHLGIKRCHFNPNYDRDLPRNPDYLEKLEAKLLQLQQEQQKQQAIQERLKHSVELLSGEQLSLF